MKTLFVCSYKEKLPRHAAPFILEQAEALRQEGIEVDFFPVQGKGVKGYLKNRKSLLQKIKTYHPDIIHAHYGLSGLLSNLQRKVPVVTTYHGSDINKKNILPLSKISMRLSAYNIFVSQQLLSIASFHKNSKVLPCGIFIDRFNLTEKTEAREKLGLENNASYILFSGAFNNAVKNYPLAKQAINICNGLILLELKGYSKDEIALLMNACDALLMTSKTEGSPQVVKEAMACNCPVVSVEVGDVPNMIAGVEGCFIANRTPEDIAAKIQLALTYGRTKGREKTGIWDNCFIAKEIIDIYNLVLRKWKK